MKKAFFILLASMLLCPEPRTCAGEFRDAGAAFSVDFPSGWTAGHSEDPAVVLKLEKGKSFFEFARLESELSDYYLKARVKEQVDALRSKGTSLSGDVRSAGMHGGSTAYYASYESMDAQVYIAFFTYRGLSYAISASGLDDGDFRSVIAAIRKPGEKIETPRPKKKKTARKPEPAPEETGVQIFKEDQPSASTASISTAALSNAAIVPAPLELSAATIAEKARPSGGDLVLEQVRGILSELETNTLKEPLIRRRPLPFYFWAALIMLWITGAFCAKWAAAGFQNPRLSPPPKNVPPDFFFPFLISRRASLQNCSYSVVTRQKQQLLASFNYERVIYLAGSVYAALFFHIIWSLLDLAGDGGVLTNALLRLPGGRLWASAPELFFAAVFAAGLALCFGKKQVLRLYDSQSNFLMEAKKDACYCIIVDGKGRELARLVKKSGRSARTWDYLDADDQVVFSIRDDNPKAWLLRKIFGRLGGSLRSRYGVFAGDRRAGFVFLDPNSSDRFQLHLDFAFARLAQPAQMLVSVLYIISRENDPFYPWPF